MGHSFTVRISSRIPLDQAPNTPKSKGQSNFFWHFPTKNIARTRKRWGAATCSRRPSVHTGLRLSLDKLLGHSTHRGGFLVCEVHKNQDGGMQFRERHVVSRALMAHTALPGPSPCNPPRPSTSYPPNLLWPLPQPLSLPAQDS